MPKTVINSTAYTIDPSTYTDRSAASDASVANFTTVFAAGTTRTEFFFQASDPGTGNDTGPFFLYYGTGVGAKMFRKVFPGESVHKINNLNNSDLGIISVKSAIASQGFIAWECTVA
jgi:hypothetical protein